VKIEFLSNHGAMGGGEVMLFQLAEAGVENGHEVAVVGPRDSEVSLHAQAMGIPFIGVDGTDRKSLLARYSSHASSSEADLLWCNGPVPSVATALSRVPRIVHLHQLPSRSQSLMLKVPRRRALATLVPSRSMATAISGSVPFLNWTAEPPVSFRDPSRTVLGQRGSSQSEPLRIGFIGRLSTVKGVDVLADAVSRLSDDIHVRLVVAGDDRFVPEESSSSVHSALGRISGQVDLVGWVDRETFHRSVDIVAVPSTWDEPFGLVAAEAMARRSPLVVTNAGALPEIVGPDHPWITERSDSIGIAAVLRRMIADPEKVEASVRNAHLRWTENFSPSAGTSRMAALLQDLG
jgi:glycosyltransferase involved in cell wall biosynthesis